MWVMIAAAVLGAFVLCAVYMTVCCSRFGGIVQLSGGKGWLKYLIAFAAAAAVFAVTCLVFDVINGIIIFLNEAFFFAVFGLAMRIVRRAAGREFAVNWQGWLAIAATVIYLLIGYYLCHHVAQTDYSLTTQKKIGTLRIALFADSHLGTTFDGAGFAEYVAKIEAQQPDIVLIAGDFVDDSSNLADLQTACAALGRMKTRCGVWYSYGNHDAGYFNHRDFNAHDLEQALTSNGIRILADECAILDDKICIAGRKDSSDTGRMHINELLAGIDQDLYTIVLDHQPNDYANEAESAADLVLSGHTHGGQLFPITYIGEWFHINDATYGHETRNGTDFIVTSGISDWEILFKTAAKSEYVIIDVQGET